MTDPLDPAFEELIDYLRDHRGFDFSGYKRTTLERRVRRRLDEVQLHEWRDYIDFLEVNADEFALLFNTILINVTSFFRDPEAWTYLREEAIPGVIARAGRSGPIRVWSAGCASGEEAASLAMVLADALGDDAFRERVKIYATDVDEDALDAARQATYPEAATSTVPDDLRDRFLERAGGRRVVRSDLRRAVIFGRHDLISDAPIGRLDFLACRNTLMYFNADAQADIVRRLHFALKPEGLLFLGKAEMLLSYATMLAPISPAHRVFSKVTGSDLRSPTFGPRSRRSAERRRLGALDRDLAFQSSSTPQIVIDAAGRVVGVNDRAQSLFAVSPLDVGLPFQEMELSYRPVELRSVVDRARQTMRPEEVSRVEWSTAEGDQRFLDVLVTPLAVVGEGVAVSVGFTDVTEIVRLGARLRQLTDELQTANEELQSTNEELETTNEELQSTNEELETTNEELQSTNEELETTNEELRSTNEQLEAINEELRRRTVEVDRAGADAAAILDSLSAAVVVVDAALAIRTWNAAASDAWGVRADEVIGLGIASLDIGLPVSDLLGAMHRSLHDASARDVSLAGVDRRGRATTWLVAIRPVPHIDGVESDAAGGLVLVATANP